jgi:hypothetical protein
MHDRRQTGGTQLEKNNRLRGNRSWPVWSKNSIYVNLNDDESQRAKLTCP